MVLWVNLIKPLAHQARLEWNGFLGLSIILCLRWVNISFYLPGKSYTHPVTPIKYKGSPTSHSASVYPSVSLATVTLIGIVRGHWIWLAFPWWLRTLNLGFPSVCRCLYFSLWELSVPCHFPTCLLVGSFVFSLSDYPSPLKFRLLAHYHLCIHTIKTSNPWLCMSVHLYISFSSSTPQYLTVCST